ncbi:uncharacterized protein [Ptychodera flava]|uniref:uncharacterized protein n=1 Tax=Ptychodera flava TaxID=63121 RepID=UPI00396AA532
MALFVLSMLGFLSLSQGDFTHWGHCELKYIPELDDHRTVCKYHMEVKYDYCMMFNDEDTVSDCEDLDGNTVKCVACCIDNADCAGTDRAIPFENVPLSCDGVKRSVISVNGEEPGPPIRVKYGAIVNLTLHNAMTNDLTTMHWHGMYQIRTPWSDGVPFITECPIPPGGTYVYIFAAIPAGTFWYHSHVGDQISGGMVGPLIVYEEDEPNQKYYDFNLHDLRNEPPLPEYDQFIMLLADWRHEEFIFRDITRFKGPRPFVGQIPTTSGLVNGRGRYNQNDPQTRTPYYGYSVKPGHRYRFRVIGAMRVTSYRISIDDHKMKIITSDGFDLNPKDFDYVIISAGERYDFILKTQDDPEYSTYKIRADVVSFDGKEDGPLNETNASVLRYGGTSGVFLSDELPPDRWRRCDDSNPCLTLNCPFGGYSTQSHNLCTSIADMTRSARELALDPTVEHVSKRAQIFMNFVIAGRGGNEPGTSPKPAINGKSFVYPTAPPFDPTSEHTTCEPECDASDHHTVCLCTYNVTLVENNYQFVFTSVGSGGSNNGSHHPIHIHGHSVFLTKMGFPEKDADGDYLQANQDLCCPCPDDDTQCCSLDDLMVPCNQPRWKNDTWNVNPDFIPMNLYNPPRKDTILLPAGGYAIVRLEADNPGWWFLHCHIEPHLDGGMVLYLNSKPDEQPGPPEGYQGCGQYFRDVEDFYDKISEHEPKLTNVALGREASLSVGSNADYGNDGDTQTCAMLADEGKTWWKVDLGDPFKVYRVILQRPDIGLVNAVVRVGSEETIEIQHQCGEVLTSRKLERGFTTVDCIEPTIGRYVSIQSDRGKTVSLCEVFVMATETPVDQPTYDSGCGMPYDISGESGTITSMGYDGTTLYENNAVCEFRVTASEGKNILLNFVAFDLEDGSDFLLVNGVQGENIAEYTGSNVPVPLDTISNKVIVIFKTNDDGQATGFRVDWEAV